MPSTFPARVHAGVPVDIGRDEARDAARGELAKSPYQAEQPSLVERAVAWLLEHLQELFARVGGGDSRIGFLGLLAVALIVVLVIVSIRLKLGPFAPRPGRGEALFGERVLTAAEHRSAAEEHAAAGRWAQAVRERLRAVIREFEQRGLLEPRPGRTADEAAAEAGAALPDHAEDLRECARVFDDVWYGGRTATADMYARLRALDETVRTARRPAVVRPT